MEYVVLESRPQEVSSAFPACFQHYKAIPSLVCHRLNQIPSFSTDFRSLHPNSIHALCYDGLAYGGHSRQLDTHIKRVFTYYNLRDPVFLHLICSRRFYKVPTRMDCDLHCVFAHSMYFSSLGNRLLQDVKAPVFNFEEKA